MSHDKLEYTITPKQLLDEFSVKYSQRGSWYSCKYCPFCEGGRSKQVFTFGVRVDDYNYNCLRTTCGAAGSFWTLLEHFGKNPKDYVVNKSKKFPTTSTKKTKGYIYRRKD